MSGIAYLDASAFVKLVAPEPESAALIAAVRSSWQHAIASEILAVEAHRVALRLGGEAPARTVSLLRLVALIPFASELRRQAQAIGPPELRSLDAIHLATAVSLTEQIGAMLTYDMRLAAAAKAAGLQVAAPGQS